MLDSLSFDVLYFLLEYLNLTEICRLSELCSTFQHDNFWMEVLRKYEFNTLTSNPKLTLNIQFMDLKTKYQDLIDNHYLMQDKDFWTKQLSAQVFFDLTSIYPVGELPRKLKELIFRCEVEQERRHLISNVGMMSSYLTADFGPEYTLHSDDNDADIVRAIELMKKYLEYYVDLYHYDEYKKEEVLNQRFMQIAPQISSLDDYRLYHQEMKLITIKV